MAGLLPAGQISPALPPAGLPGGRPGLHQAPPRPPGQTGRLEAAPGLAQPAGQEDPPQLEGRQSGPAGQGAELLPGQLPHSLSHS